MNLLQGIEWISVFLNLGFVILLIKENKLAWPLGILGSLLSIYLFIETKLYSEAILYSYYVAMGVYGWYMWSKPAGEKLAISDWRLSKHFVAICIGIAGTTLLGYFFDTNSDAKMPYADAFSTVFSFIATYMEAKKILSTWYYWIVLNAYSVWLYHVRELEIYALLMVVYAVLSIAGLVQWRKSYLAQSSG